MSQTISLGSVAQLPHGEGRTFHVRGERVPVFRTRDGALFATQAECPHRQGPLSDGLLGRGTLICPLHEWKFDLSTGKTTQSDCALRMYPVHCSDDGTLLLEWHDA